MYARGKNIVFEALSEGSSQFYHCHFTLTNENFKDLMVGKANHLYGDENSTPEDVDTSSLVKLTELLNTTIICDISVSV